MYICRNKLVYYHIVKDFERIYFSLLKYKNNYTIFRIDQRMLSILLHLV